MALQESLWLLKSLTSPPLLSLQASRNPEALKSRHVVGGGPEGPSTPSLARLSGAWARVPAELEQVLPSGHLEPGHVRTMGNS